LSLTLRIALRLLHGHILTDAAHVLARLTTDSLVGTRGLLVLLALRCALRGKLLAQLGQLGLLLLLGQRLDLSVSSDPTNIAGVQGTEGWV
jgi:hypothetical protein